MNCFNHPDKTAIGICKHCNKGLCNDCAVDLYNGLGCKGHCEIEVKEINEFIEFNKSRYKQIKKHGSINRVLFYVAIIFLSVIIFSKVFSDGSRKNTDSSISENILERKIESGIYNNNSLDTLLLKQRKIYFNTDFNEISCSWLIKQLFLIDSFKEKTDIDLYLCSSGGSIGEAKAVCNAMKSLSVKVNTYASGYCASSCLRIVASGTGIRAAYDNTVFLFHGQDFQQAHIDHSYESVARKLDLKEWMSITHLPEKIIVDKSDLYLTPEEALEYGIIDTILAWPPRD
jgi:ATP-dependent protease ClpP protease subunit